MSERPSCRENLATRLFVSAEAGITTPGSCAGSFISMFAKFEGPPTLDFRKGGANIWKASGGNGMLFPARQVTSRLRRKFIVFPLLGDHMEWGQVVGETRSGGNFQFCLGDRLRFPHPG